MSMKYPGEESTRKICFNFSRKMFIFVCRSLQDVKSRLDLRLLAVCSIDPPGCTDIDDALHWRLLPNGNYEVREKKTIINRVGMLFSLFSTTCIMFRISV